MAIVFTQTQTAVVEGSFFVINGPYTPVSITDIEIPGILGDIYPAEVVSQLSEGDLLDLDSSPLICVKPQEIDTEHYKEVLAMSSLKNSTGEKCVRKKRKTKRSDGFNVEPCNGFRSVFPTALSHCDDLHETETEAWESIITVIHNQPIASNWKIATPDIWLQISSICVH